ncbi:hypothetical protein BC938DRAFT_471011 [Jimgerdemannia flammicorona]|uniref:RNA polymerase Rpb6 n=1 Tax=Jimgerdemannia flammicorona TaxID=994334 RepID=A0A433Q958_9FUNG|nr:hypothetical protein BC938DRAFT_471011 [Jimgerdemannia flammicorona]
MMMVVMGGRLVDDYEEPALDETDGGAGPSAPGGIAVLTSGMEADMTDDLNETGGASGEHKEKVTTPYMTKYERARILGTRALQIR